MDIKTIYEMARESSIDKIYLHWSAGRHNQVFNDYHINILGDGSIVLTTNDFDIHKNHTYKRNTGSIGITFCAMLDATPDDYGPEPVTDAQIYTMSLVVAALCKGLGVDPTINTVLTHAEAGDNKDGVYPDYEDNGQPYGMYGPDHNWERWDLWKLHPYDAPYSGGDIIRGNAVWHMNNTKEILDLGQE